GRDGRPRTGTARLPARPAPRRLPPLAAEGYGEPAARVLARPARPPRGDRRQRLREGAGPAGRPGQRPEPGVGPGTRPARGPPTAGAAGAGVRAGHLAGVPVARAGAAADGGGGGRARRHAQRGAYRQVARAQPAAAGDRRVDRLTGGWADLDRVDCVITPT